MLLSLGANTPLLLLLFAVVVIVLLFGLAFLNLGVSYPSLRRYPCYSLIFYSMDEDGEEEDDSEDNLEFEVGLSRWGWWSPTSEHIAPFWNTLDKWASKLPWEEEASSRS